MVINRPPQLEDTNKRRKRETCKPTQMENFTKYLNYIGNGSRDIRAPRPTYDSSCKSFFYFLFLFFAIFLSSPVKKPTPNNPVNTMHQQRN
jgi:hypothetical protein